MDFFIDLATGFLPHTSQDVEEHGAQCGGELYGGVPSPL